MKITKRQLKRIIKEEKKKLLKEQWGASIETGSELIEFSRAYASLGAAVQDSLEELLRKLSGEILPEGQLHLTSHQWILGR
jgi:hypothetical protein